MGTGAQPSWWPHLHKLEADTLLVTGDLDQKFCRVAEEMQKEIKKCRMDKCSLGVDMQFMWNNQKNLVQ